MFRNSGDEIFFLDNSNDRDNLIRFVRIKNANEAEFELIESSADSKLIIASTPDLGPNQLGAFAAKTINKGESLGPYIGVDLFGRQNTKIINKKVKKMPENNFLFQEDFQDGTSIVVDAEKKGSALRFVNHGQNPNVQAIYNEQTKTIDFVATKEILCGEEVIVSYGAGFFAENQEISYSGYSIQSFLQDLATTNNVFITIPNVLSIESIKEILHRINFSFLENFCNDEFYSPINAPNENLVIQVASNEDDFDARIFDVREADEQTIMSFFSDHDSDQKSESKQEKEKETKAEFLYVDEKTNIHPIHFLQNGDVLYTKTNVIEKLNVDSRRYIKGNCLAYPDSGKFIEPDKTIKIEDTGILTNQFGTQKLFWILDKDGNKQTQVTKKKCLTNKRKMEEPHKNKFGLPPGKRSKFVNYNTVDIVENANEAKVDLTNDKEHYIYVDDADNYALKSVLFERVDMTNYNRIYFDEKTGSKKQIIKVVDKTRRHWSDRLSKCLVYSSGTHQGEFVKPNNKEKIIEEKEDPAMPTIKKNQYSTTKYWLVTDTAGEKIELFKKNTFYVLNKKNRLFSKSENKDTSEKESSTINKPNP